ncbi:MAG: DNA mismatch repair endonuclease MutL, partial [Leptospiraceae bacterium]|nr:DNA mismatch repair endonuclease MutL [Leptospiraceae bacterium]
MSSSPPQELRRIQALSTLLIDKIAAGEVIEAPFSVIKELVENSLDAGAQNMQVETEGGGMERISIEDDGHGIHPDDLRLCLQRHATSKIRELDDLEKLYSFGFRGEALAAIGAVSRLTIRSRQASSPVAHCMESRGGRIVTTNVVAAPVGTAIAVNELFYATPARRKFVKSERSENMRITGELRKLALAHPSVSWRYIRDAKPRLHWTRATSLQERIGQIFQPQLLDHLLAVDFEYQGMRLHGFISDEDYYRANREGQYSFVNGRSVEIQNFGWLVKKAYGELLAPGSHPWSFLFLEVDPARLDVNVHPRKLEVRLLDHSQLYSLVQGALDPVLRPRMPLSMPWSRSRTFTDRQQSMDVLSHFKSQHPRMPGLE